MELKLHNDKRSSQSLWYHWTLDSSRPRIPTDPAHAFSYANIFPASCLHLASGHCSSRVSTCDVSLTGGKQSLSTCWSLTRRSQTFQDLEDRLSHGMQAQQQLRAEKEGRPYICLHMVYITVAFVIEVFPEFCTLLFGSTPMAGFSPFPPFLKNEHE